MNEEIEKLVEKIQSLGGDPVSLLKQALSEQVQKVKSPVLISCSSCKNQNRCSFNSLATKLIHIPPPFPAVEQLFGAEFYSQIATVCGAFKVIQDTVFGVKGEY